MNKHTVIGRLIISILMAGFLLSACSAQPSSTPVGSGTAATSAKPYGSLVVGWSQPIDRLDPASSLAPTYGGYLASLFDSLTTLNSDGNIAPGLAERWEISDDGLTHTYYIRKGVKFHDGSPLTAADVKFTMERVVAPDPTFVTSAANIWRSLAPRVEIKDDYTVVVQFKTPQFGLPKPITDFFGVLAVVPKKYIEAKGIDYFRKNPVGSGPWEFVSLAFGDRIEYEANEDYWDPNLVPKFKNLRILSVPEESTRIAMIKTGEVDLADVSPTSAASLKSAGLRIKSWDGGQQANYAILYDVKNPAAYPFGDVRVRKATSLAINRKEMADSLFAGYAEPGIMTRVQRTFDFFDATQLKPDPYDADGAKKLLAEAGYPNGFNAKIWDHGGGSSLSTFSQALAGYWRKVGINTAIEPIDFNTIVNMVRTYSDARVWNTVFPSGIGSNTTTTPVEFDIGASFSTRTGFYKNHTNQKLDDLIDKYPMTKDPAERKAIAREASIVAKNEFSDPSVVIASTIWALGSKIGDLRPIQGQGNLGAAFSTITHAK